MLQRRIYAYFQKQESRLRSVSIPTPYISEAMSRNAWMGWVQYIRCHLSLTQVKGGSFGSYLQNIFLRSQKSENPDSVLSFFVEGKGACAEDEDGVEGWHDYLLSSEKFIVSLLCSKCVWRSCGRSSGLMLLPVRLTRSLGMICLTKQLISYSAPIT